MFRAFFVFVNLLAMVSSAHSQIPSVSAGSIKRFENFSSDFVTPRNIDVWLPEGYSDEKKYAVLYMHDGQMLFDSTITWNHQAWEVDDIATKLQLAGKVTNFIVVGIWNGGLTRHKDYFPQRPFDNLPQVNKDTITQQLRNAGRINETFQPVSDNYLLFLTKELKPFIDRTFSVKKGRRHTMIAGSSMGGLISMYAVCEYPEIFGAAACLSTHWPGVFSLTNNPMPDAFVAYLKSNLPLPGKNRIYFDFGDQTLDALYPECQKKVDQVMREAGFDHTNWQTAYFPGADHSEKAWRNRLDTVLKFLGGK
jgi:enterochelin esterase-like enzyme